MQTRIFTPRIAVQAYKATGTTIGFTTKSYQWIDCAYPDVVHYGIKYWLPSTGGVTTGICSMLPIITYYVKFQSVR